MSLPQPVIFHICQIHNLQNGPTHKNKHLKIITFICTKSISNKTHNNIKTLSFNIISSKIVLSC